MESVTIPIKRDHHLTPRYAEEQARKILREAGYAGNPLKYAGRTEKIASDHYEVTFAVR